jgi:hypothetical protein
VARTQRKIKAIQCWGLKKPWWPFISLAHYMVPLLHCKIRVGNQLLDWLRAIINKHIARYSPGEEALIIITSITTLKCIITATAKVRDNWDNSAEGGKKQKIVMRVVTAYSRQSEINLEEPVRVRPAQPGLTWRNPSGWPAQPGLI